MELQDSFNLPAYLQQPSGAVLENLRSCVWSFAQRCMHRMDSMPDLPPALRESIMHMMMAEAQSAVGHRMPLPAASPPPIPVPAVQTHEVHELQLRFHHKCLSLGCNEHGCGLCEMNPRRRCKGNFAAKYLVNDALKAKCGATIHLEVVDPRTLEPVPADELAAMQLEICVVDGTAYQRLAESNRERHEADVQQCMRLQNKEGKGLLSLNRSVTNANVLPDKKLLVEMTGGQGHLHDLTITGSSEALLQGHKSCFKLLARATQGESHVAYIRPAISEAFAVATTRTRGAVKADIPHVEEHVCRLEKVGKETHSKLQDIRAAAKTVGISTLETLHNRVDKVGEFRDLVRQAESDHSLRDSLQKALKLDNKAWQAARDHALRAVDTDNRLRIWYVDASMSTGLIFKCSLGSVDLDHPLGLVQETADSMAGGPSFKDILLMEQLSFELRDVARKLQQKATECWWQLRHPGWAIRDIESDAFLGPIDEMRTRLAQSIEISPTSFSTFQLESSQPGTHWPATQPPQPRFTGAHGLPPSTRPHPYGHPQDTSRPPMNRPGPLGRGGQNGFPAPSMARSPWRLMDGEGVPNLSNAAAHGPSARAEGKMEQAPGLRHTAAPSSLQHIAHRANVAASGGQQVADSATPAGRPGYNPGPSTFAVAPHNLGGQMQDSPAMMDMTGFPSGSGLHPGLSSNDLPPLPPELAEILHGRHRSFHAEYGPAGAAPPATTKNPPGQADTQSLKPTQPMPNAHPQQQQQRQQAAQPFRGQHPSPETSPGPSKPSSPTSAPEPSRTVGLTGPVPEAPLAPMSPFGEADQQQERMDHDNFRDSPKPQPKGQQQKRGLAKPDSKSGNKRMRRSASPQGLSVMGNGPSSRAHSPMNGIPSNSAPFVFGALPSLGTLPSGPTAAQLIEAANLPSSGFGSQQEAELGSEQHLSGSVRAASIDEHHKAAAILSNMSSHTSEGALASLAYPHGSQSGVLNPEQAAMDPMTTSGLDPAGNSAIILTGMSLGPVVKRKRSRASSANRAETTEGVPSTKSPGAMGSWQSEHNKPPELPRSALPLFKRTQSAARA